MTVSQILAQLDHILASPAFDASQRNREFLQYVVDETLGGRGDRIKAYAIAVAVFNRDDTFDPQADPIVRIEASRLRRSLERYYLLAGRDDPLRIDIPKGGYTPTFEPVERDVPADAAVVSPSVSVEPVAPGEPGPDAWLPGFPWRAAALALGTLLVVAVAVILSDRFIPTTSDTAGAEAARLAAIAAPPSILVLPFENLGPNPSEDFLGHGLSEEVLQNLLRFSEVRVFDARASGATDDALASARLFGADYVLRGTVRHGGATIRVTAQLVSVATSASIWGHTFDVPYDVEALFAIEDSIAASVAATVAQPYGVMYHDLLARIARSAPETMSAYRCILRTYDYRADISAEGHAASRDCLEEAVAREAGYADAWAMLALVRLDEHRFDFNRPPQPYDPLESALAAADRAIVLNPDSAAAHHARSEVLFFGGEIDEAFEEAERALALNPNNADAMATFGLRLIMTGTGERGPELVREAMALNPTPPGWYHFAPSLVGIRAGDYEAALDAAREIDMPTFYLQHVLLGAVYGHVGRRDEARAAVEAAGALNPRFIACPRTLLGERHLEPGLIDAILDGLAAGGLTLPDEATVPECVA